MIEKSSYVASNGFGHEEWLFNFGWLQQSGGSEWYKYGFLQPIGKYREAYEGKSFDVLLYAIAPNQTRVAVAIIENLLVPPIAELTRAVRHMRAQGWIADMKSDLNALGLSSEPLKGRPEHFINIKFRPADVCFFEQPHLLERSHKTYKSNRYQPLDLDELPTAERRGKKKEGPITIPAKPSVTYSAAHSKMQNALYDHLCEQHGKSFVHYEADFVDLSVTIDGTTTFFEIKTANTAKACVREAIGQLLEYGYYPGEERASKLIVVGDQELRPDDHAYIVYLRNKFSLPIFYGQWSWEKKKLLVHA